MPPDESVEEELELFAAAAYETGKPHRFPALREHLWTERKAQLIARYLQTFVYVTKHGTYVDLFAGRQREELEDGWAAEQVMLMQPNAMHLRRFFLFELDTEKVVDLRALASDHPRFDSTVTQGDSNKRLLDVLPAGSLGEREATFCLIDQRTTECSWATVEHLTRLKAGGLKPELFYFFAHGWIDRAVKSRKTPEAIRQTEDWWGRGDVDELLALEREDRALLVARRFKDEFGYRYAHPWPIRAQPAAGRLMFYMIHATDHQRAPDLMRLAYEWVIAPAPDNSKWDQLRLDLEASDYEEEALDRILLVDNRLSDLATYDDSALIDVLDQLAQSDGGLAGTGYDPGDLDKLIDKLDGTGRDGIIDFDERYEVVIECQDEREQEALLLRLSNEGLKVRALVV